jgi:hypothetical protein
VPENQSYLTENQKIGLGVIGFDRKSQNPIEKGSGNRATSTGRRMK